jgi:hypothetical protein
VLVYSSSVRLVFWYVAYDTTTELLSSGVGASIDGSGTPPYVAWARVEGTMTTLALGWGGASRTAVNLDFWGQPFQLDSRVFLPVRSTRHLFPGEGVTAMGYYKGCYITEVEPTISSAEAMLFPQAACCLDLAGLQAGRNVSVVDGKAYIATTRRKNNPGDPNASRIYYEHQHAYVYVFDFSDPYRWQPAVHDHMVIFSGALPYVYDGKNVHECGFISRPEIMGYAHASSGNLDPDETYTYRMTFEFRDANGRRWMSQPSYATEAESIDDPETTNLSMMFAYSRPSLNAMLDAGFYFTGPLTAVLWRATAANAAAGVFIRDTSSNILPTGTSNLGFISQDSDADIDDSERLYIVGGELENYPAPPCRSICQHRDRLIAYNTEFGTVDYTKPMQADRGIEWSLSQRIPSPEKIVAIVSLEHTCLLFSANKIYALEGAGPGPTGVPPDAFARLVLVNADVGCTEVNAAWRCPAGVIFRSRGGFWLVDRGLSVSYIGAPVEADYDEMTEDDGNFHALCGVVDEKKNCLRIYVDGSIADVSADVFPAQCIRFNYWFDTGRWSVDQIQTSSPKWATYHRNRNVIAWGNSGESLVPIAIETPGVYSDDDLYYAMSIKTGWIRFGDMQSFKRVWRTLFSVEHSDSNLRLKIWRDFDDETALVEEDITADTLGDGGPKLIRIHMPVQKVRALRVLVSEYDSVLVADDAQGFRFYGIGFELGMKRGAYKAATVSL